MVQKQNNIKELILAIINFVSDYDGYVTKTKLLKYLYLIDVENYRLNKSTITNFNWFYYKFGPYSKEFEEIYKQLEISDIKVKNIKNLDYDTQVINAERTVEIDDVIKDVRIKLIIKGILKRWAKEKLAQMLDYVYFETEPMEHAIKNQNLDFSTIEPFDPKENVFISYPKVKKKQIEKIRENINKKLALKKRGVDKNTLFPSQNFDENYLSDLLNLDLEES